MIFPMAIGNFSIPPQSTDYTVSDVFRLGDFIPSFIVPSVKVYGVIPTCTSWGGRSASAT